MVNIEFAYAAPDHYHLPLRASGERKLEPGSVWVVALKKPWHLVAMKQSIARLLESNPATDGVLHVPSGEDLLLAEIRTYARSIGLSGVIAGEEWDVEVLRREIADPKRIPAELARCANLDEQSGDLRLHRLVGNLMAVSSVAEVVGAGRPLVQGASRGAGHQRLYRQAKRSTGLSLQELLWLTKSVKAMVELQRDPELTIERAALMNGFSSASSFSTVCRRRWGQVPSSLRRIVGLRFLLERYLRRRRRRVRNPELQV